MIYDASAIAIGVFLAFVLFVIGLSFYLGRKTKSAEGYFAAGGNIHWSVNGIAFAGDYLSAASFLGICGMIAFSGYDGFLYSMTNKATTHPARYGWSPYLSSRNR